MKAIVLAGSRGIGREIARHLDGVASEIVATSRRELDTSNLDSVRAFAERHPTTDVLVLNTGGPPSMPFDDIDEATWRRWFDQLFLSFVVLLQKIHVNDGGYVFLVSSFNIREPDPKLVLSNSLRLAFTSVFKSVSQLHMKRKVSFINIAPGPTKTDRLDGILEATHRTLAEYEAKLASGRAAEPSDIGKFVRAVVEGRLTALSGVTIPFDMGLGRFVL